MSFTSIDYEEPKQKTYKAVSVCDNNNKTVLFNTGDFVKDWYDSIKHLLTNLADEPNHMHSTSVDHFQMDGNGYDSMYMTFNEETNSGELSTEYGDGIEFFVKAGTKPTWDELRKLCGDKKNL